MTSSILPRIIRDRAPRAGRYIGEAVHLSFQGRRRRSSSRRVKLSLPFVVLITPSDVMPYVGMIQANADTDKNALGFWPAYVYEEAARKGNLFVAVKNNDKREYAGHILFGMKYPHGRIFQTFVSPAVRVKGLGRQMLEAVIRLAEHRGFLSLIAKVASDRSSKRILRGFRL